jgi:RHS repeat-associated protein
VTAFKRDLLGRVFEREDDADGVTKFTWSVQQGRLGLLESTESPDGTKTEHWYDDFGRPTTSMWTLNAGDAYSVTRHYDLMGRLKAIDYPAVPERSQFSIEYDYTAYNDLEKIRDPASQGLPFWTVQGRNADGALTKALRGDGATHKRSYQLLTGRLDVLELEQAGKALDSIKHTYFLNGNLKSRTDAVNGRTETFGYDDLERLTSWKLDTSAGTRETSYLYDLLGNLEQVYENGQLTADNVHGANGKPHALTLAKSAGAQGIYVYDAIGRITQGGGRAIEYTAFDLPKSITQGGVTTDFAYDAFGRRVRKSKPGSSSIYVAELYEKREKNGEIEHVFFIPGEFGPIAEVHWKQSKPQEDKTLYLHGDALGSTRVVTGGQGGGVERIYFEPFGQRIEYDGTPSAQGYTPSTEIGLTGFQQDDDLGLINARGRVYDPAIRQFVTPDPLVAFPLFGQSYNRFAYCLNNPLRFVDPTGFAPKDGPPNLRVTGTPNLDAPRRASPTPRSSSAGKAQPSQSGAKGVTSASADANGNETNTGPRALATPPPSVTPPPATEAANSPATAAPAAATQASPAAAPDADPEPGPPIGPLPPSDSNEGAPGGDLDAESWKDSSLAQSLRGFSFGVAAGLVPGGGTGARFATESRLMSPVSATERHWRAGGEVVGGAILVALGASGKLAGGLLAFTGIGAVPGAAVVAVSFGLVTAGLGNIAEGYKGLQQSLSTGSGGSRHPSVDPFKGNDPDVPVSKLLQGKGQIRALTSNPNLRGVDTASLVNKTLRELRGELNPKQWKTLMKHFEGRDLRHGR